MIMLASILGGSVIGYRSGADRRGTRQFLIVWIAVFAFQTALLLLTSDDPRNRDTGAWELGYFPFSLVILVLGLAALHGAAALSRRRGVRHDAGVAR